MESFYDLDNEAIRGLIDWSALPDAVRETLRGSALLGFVTVAISAIRDGSLDAGDSKALLCWQPVAVDQEGWNEVRDVLADASRRVEVAVKGSTARLKSKKQKEGKGSVHAVVGLAAFPALPLQGPAAANRQRH